MKKYGSSIAQFTKKFRQHQNLTQAELAARLGVTTQYVCNIERARHLNPVTFCTRLAPLLDPSRLLHLEALKQRAILNSIKTRERKLR
jgi:DNA-binding XRE family transcriptional regulator